MVLTRFRQVGRYLSVVSNKGSVLLGAFKDTPILISDEPTASLDLVTEQALINTYLKSYRSTGYYYAHRLSTIRMADQILFFNDGRLEDSGTHEELISKEDGPTDSSWNWVKRLGSTALELKSPYRKPV